MLKSSVRLPTPGYTGRSDQGEGDRKGVQSVERAFDILGVVAASAGSASVAEIARALESSPSKVHHYLISLVRCGALRQTGRGAYDLGPTTLGLGLASLSRLDTVERTCGVAEDLRDALGESVFVAVWGNRGPTVIRYFEGRKALAVEARAGLVLPLLTSATGRVFLAWETPGALAPLIDEEGGSEAEVERLRTRARSEGVGRVDGDLLPRIASLSAPVFSFADGLCAAITVLGWSGEIDSTVDGEVATLLKGHAARLSAEFGHPAGS